MTLHQSIASEDAAWARCANGETGLDTIPDAIAAIARGEFVVVVDDEDRENEGDLIIAAEHATPRKIGFMVRRSSGVLCVAMTAERAEHLELPQMVARNRDSMRTAYTVSVDLTAGLTTGISATERARTIAGLADPAARADDFVRPGHVFPLVARPGGVRERPGHTEASVELARLASCQPVGALSEIVGDDGEPLRLQALKRFAAAHGLCIISIRDLIAYLGKEG